MVQKQKAKLIAGVDEAGRGPLAGPVVAAAVILNPRRKIKGLKDSKLLTAEERERLYGLIVEKSHAWAVGSADVQEIDEINILQATLLAMRRAVLNLPMEPREVRVDGNICPKIPFPVTAYVSGDQLFEEISAASIIAKVTRDRQMIALDADYPHYGFASHKGYSTPEHLRNLKKFGASPIHRRSFEPVMQVELQTELLLEELE